MSLNVEGKHEFSQDGKNIANEDGEEQSSINQITLQLHASPLLEHPTVHISQHVNINIIFH